MQHGTEGGEIGRHQVLLVAAADESEGLPPTIRRCFSHEIRMGSLTEEQRSRMLTQSLQSVSELLNVCGFANSSFLCLLFQVLKHLRQ